MNIKEIKTTYKNKHIVIKYQYQKYCILSNYTTKVSVKTFGEISSINFILPNKIQLIIFGDILNDSTINNCIQPTNKLKIQYDVSTFNYIYIYSWIYPFAKHKKISNIITNIIFQHTTMFTTISQTKNIFLFDNINNRSILYLKNNHSKIIIFKNIKNITIMFFCDTSKFTKLSMLKNVYLLYVDIDSYFGQMNNKFDLNKLCNVHKLHILNCKQKIITYNILKNYFLNMSYCTSGFNNLNFTCVVKLKLIFYAKYCNTTTYTKSTVRQLYICKYKSKSKSNSNNCDNNCNNNNCNNGNILLYKHVDLLSLIIV